MPRTAWLEIDLAALVANLGVLRRLAGPGVGLEPVVKADAYGHGMVPIARALVEAGASGLCVAAFDEAVVLRMAGVKGRISVLYPIPPERAVEAARRSIAIAVGDMASLRVLIAAVGPSGRPPRDRRARYGARQPPRLRIELEVETGLGRGGLAPEAIVEAVRTIQTAPGVRLAGLWSHLQAAEDRDRTAAQVRRFEAAGAALVAAGLPMPRRHLAASGGLLVPGVPSYDAVRPGIATYGIVPDELDPSDWPPAARELQPVLSLHARPVRVAVLPANHGISYGPTFETARPSRIATLPIGYGDGWSRSLSNRAFALVRATRVPLVGNVAMDAVMADVTDVPGPPVTTDDEFVLIGVQGTERITALDVAQSRNTNTWEVITSMSRRLTRVYDAPAGMAGYRSLITREGGWLESNSGTATSAISRSTRS